MAEVAVGQTVANKTMTLVGGKQAGAAGAATPFAVNADGSLPTSRAGVSAAVLANVAASITSVTLFAANTAAMARQIVNDSTATLYLKFGAAAASTTSYTVALAPVNGAGIAAYYEFPAPLYFGQVTGIWSAANGSARTTEE